MGSAVLSNCERYRYYLHRDVGILGDKVIAYFGINPSTADAAINDQTVRKWIGFTQRNSGKKFIVGNVFAYRATDVHELASVADPVGHENNLYLARIIDEADILIPCWGSKNKIPSKLHYRLGEVTAMLLSSGKPTFTFGLTASGDPKHPLVVGYDTPLIQFTEKAR